MTVVDVDRRFKAHRRPCRNGEWRERMAALALLTGVAGAEIYVCWCCWRDRQLLSQAARILFGQSFTPLQDVLDSVHASGLPYGSDSRMTGVRVMVMIVRRQGFHVVTRSR